MKKLSNAQLAALRLARDKGPLVYHGQYHGRCYYFASKSVSELVSVRTVDGLGAKKMFQLHELRSGDHVTITPAGRRALKVAESAR